MRRRSSEAPAWWLAMVVCVLVGFIVLLAWWRTAEALGPGVMLYSSFEDAFTAFDDTVVSGTGTVLDTFPEPYAGAYSMRCRAGSTAGEAYAHYAPTQTDWIRVAWRLKVDRMMTNRRQHCWGVKKGSDVDPTGNTAIIRPWAIDILDSDTAPEDSFRIMGEITDDVRKVMTITELARAAKGTWHELEVYAHQANPGGTWIFLNGQQICHRETVIDTGFVDSVLIGCNSIAGYYLTPDTGNVYIDSVVYDSLIGYQSGPYTRVFEAMNETVNLTEWQYQHESGSGVVDDSNITRNSIGRGLVAFPGPSGASYAFANRHFVGGKNTHVHAYFTPGTLNTSGGAVPGRAVFQLRQRGDAVVKCAITVADLGTTFRCAYSVTDDDNLSTVAYDTMALGEWVRMDLFVLAADEPNGIMAVYLNGLPFIYNDTLDTDGAKPDSLRVGINTMASTTNSGYVAFDDIVVDTMPCPPPCGIPPVRAEYGLSSPFGGF